MWPDRVSNPGPQTYESGALPIALRDPATFRYTSFQASLTFLQIFKASFKLKKKSLGGIALQTPVY